MYIYMSIYEYIHLIAIVLGGVYWLPIEAHWTPLGPVRAPLCSADCSSALVTSAPTPSVAPPAVPGPFSDYAGSSEQFIQELYGKSWQFLLLKGWSNP